MSFLQIYVQALIVIMAMMTILWFISIFIKNVSIVDIFWGPGFVITSLYYFMMTEGFETRKIIVMLLVLLWGLRLSSHIAIRNKGKGEDFRYREFRKKYGENRYWWISFFQTFMLQGILMWLISAPLLGAQFYSVNSSMGILDFAGLLFWITGFIFETFGDLQLTRFRANPGNRGKVLNSGLWKYTRHPNYFGDSAVWWGYGLLCFAGGSYIPFAGSLLMTALIIKVSGVALLEKSLVEQKPQYREYIETTSSFFPWFRKKKKQLS